MAPPPTGEDSAANFDTPRSLPTPFLSKTYQLVDDHSIDDVISWNEDGSTFVVWNPTEFAKDLLPKCFKHNNFSSFVRQLNTYGFRKIVPDRWEFYNEFFRRGEKRLLCDIQRRKMATSASPAAIPVTVAAAVPAPQPLRTVSPTDSGEEQVISSNSSPAANRETNCETNAELIDENERLKKENIQLNKELSQVKSLCNNIYVLMSNYANNNQPAIKQLDLLPAAKRSETTSERDENRTGSEGNVSPRLFGFPIGVKRPRESEGKSADHDNQLHLQQPGTKIKSEPSDVDSEKTYWLKQCQLSNQRVCN